MGKSKGPLFTFSTAESLVLVFLLIALFGGIAVRVAQRAWPAGKGVVVEEARDALRHRIDLNAASEETLTLVPGIGSARARKIVEYRSKQGGFGEIDELTNIDGFSTGLVDQLRRYFRIRSSTQRYAE